MFSSNNPDVLLCLANLSSDEVFTPPKIVNHMLDLLPQELFTSPDTKFLDPASKSGVFLREIVKRLIKGLAETIPDLQERVNHIMKHQVYGMGITYLTGLITRRTVYCSRNANSIYSVCRFDNSDGNILFREIEHTFRKGKCIFCGVSEERCLNVDIEDEENKIHAYEFIHTERPEGIFGAEMKFDVVISNPPYQMSDGGHGSSAMPIYHKFVEQAKKLNPKYITMIIPARWYAGGKGLDDFRHNMLNDKCIKELHDFPEAFDCFDGVQIKGGICYFLWDREHNGDCKIITHRGGKSGEYVTRPLIEKGIDTFIRYNEAVSILRKVRKFKEGSFALMVQPSKPFGLRTYFHGEKEPGTPHKLKCYDNEGVSYVSPGIIRKNSDWVDKWKVLIPRLGSGSDSFPHMILGRPFIGEPYSVCSETYLVIGPCDTENIALNILSYITTKFFRFLVLLKKNTQDAPARVYSLVPLQDFSHSWTDEALYAKYGLTPEEISFIDSMIRPMTLT